MHEMRLECHLDDGIFMKCKIRNAFILFFISTSILILTLFSEYRCYKTILFYEYNFKAPSTTVNKSEAKIKGINLTSDWQV